MKVSILRNEPFAMLSVATGFSEEMLEGLIVRRLTENRIISKDESVHGSSIQSIASSKGLDVPEFIELVFPEWMKNHEVFQLLDSIIVQFRFTVEYQFENRDCRDFDLVYVTAKNATEAIERAKNGFGVGYYGQQKIPPKYAFKFIILDQL